MRTSLDLCFCLLTLCGITPVLCGVKVVMEQDRDAVLPCLIRTKENLTEKIFLWKKDGQKEEKKVFIYRSGFHSNNKLTGQDEQFKGRVSHFQDQLMNGNASIKIHNTKMADSGSYSCIFPRLQPSQTSIIELVVSVKVVVEEGSDAVLPCLISTEENITGKTFLWKKDGQKEVFIYRSGIHSNNALTVQDEQFKHRVSHFDDQLMNGNASIKIHNTKVTDSGNYRCIFPHHSQTFIIKLVVGASPKPYVTTLDQSKDGALLQCEVRGASPKPKVEWQDSSGNILPAEEPQVSESRSSFSVTLKITVTKNDHYRCEVTQEEIGCQSYSETFVFINENKVDIGSLFGGIVIGAVVLAVVQIGLVATKCITVTPNRVVGDPGDESEPRQEPLKGSTTSLLTEHIK